MRFVSFGFASFRFASFRWFVRHSFARSLSIYRSVGRSVGQSIVLSDKPPDPKCDRPNKSAGPFILGGWPAHELASGWADGSEPRCNQLARPLDKALEQSAGTISWLTGQLGSWLQARRARGHRASCLADSLDLSELARSLARLLDCLPARSLALSLIYNAFSP